jgi:hypothetical protein
LERDIRRIRAETFKNLIYARAHRRRTRFDNGNGGRSLEGLTRATTEGVDMRRFAILMAMALVSAVGVSPAAGQVLEDPLPDLPVPVPDVPDVDVPDLPGGGGGGGGDDTPIDLPGTGGGGVLGGSGGGGGDPVSGSGGSGGGLTGSGGSGGGGGEKSGGGERQSRSDSCPCATAATGNPVAGDYDKCPVEDGAFATDDEVNSALAAPAGPGGGPDSGSGGALGAQSFGEDPSSPGAAGAVIFGSDSGSSMLAGALLGVSGLVLLVGIAGGVRALHGRLRTDSRFP